MHRFVILDVRRRRNGKAATFREPCCTRWMGWGKTLDQLDRKQPIAVHCKGGYRSAIACSLLEAAGFEGVVNVIGGFDAWAAAGLKVE